MKSSEVIQTLKSAIKATREQGVDKVSLDDLDAYAAKLDELSQQTPENAAAGEAEMEKYRANLSAWISSREQEHEVNLEMLRSVITVGQSALRSALLINGGAAVALLAFIGQLWTGGEIDSALGEVADGLLQFVWGVLAAAGAAGATYFSQAGYAGEFGRVSQAVGRTGHVLAVAGVFLAYYLFAKGALITFEAVRGSVGA